MLLGRPVASHDVRIFTTQENIYTSIFILVGVLMVAVQCVQMLVPAIAIQILVGTTGMGGRRPPS